MCNVQLEVYIPICRLTTGISIVWELNKNYYVAWKLEVMEVWIPQNYFLQSRFLNKITAPLAAVLVQIDFTVKGYKNYRYYQFQIHIKLKNFKNVQ